MFHPDLWLDLAKDKHQDRLSEAETWRLVKAARQQRASYMGQLLRRLIVAVRQNLRLKTHFRPVKPDLTNLH